MKSILKFLVAAIVLFAVNASFAQDKMMKDKMDDKMMKDEITVVQLSQTPGVYETTTLNLTPGKYIFEVTNKNVDKKLGFYLVDGGKKQVANSGLENLVKKGETAQTGVVELKAGTYNYSCPLNPTPHYTLTVADKQMDHKMDDKMMKDKMGDKMGEMKEKVGEMKDKMGDKMMDDKKMDDKKMAKDKMVKEGH